MPPPSAATSSATSLSVSRSKKRRWTREQLLHCLELLSDIPPPLSHKLPISPPCSRPSSPAPGSKRKSDSSLDSDHPKRPRTSSFSERQHQPQPPPSQQLPPAHQPLSSAHPSSDLSQPPAHFRSSNPNPITTSRSEPCEDGEVREDIPPPHPRGSAADCALPPPNAVPIRRPKRGRPSIQHFDRLHDKYHNAGRMLKYSGDARFWSTYPPTHKEYRSLHDPPPVNSPYHKHGGLIARLELVDALVCFTYSIWARDYSRKACNKDTWTTIEAFLTWCKSKWHAEDAINDAEKAFLGLIYMIEAFINGRKMLYSVRQQLDYEMDKITEQAKAKIETAIQEVDQGTLLGTSTGLLANKSQGTPPMLPSPASIAPTNSANSTPTNRDGNTPNTTTRAASTSQNPPPRQARLHQGPNPAFYPLLPRRVRESQIPPPATYIEAASAVTEPIDINMIFHLKDLTSTFKSSSSSMQEAQNTLNLPIMARHFPRTFARMVYSTLSPTEEHEPDFEDEEGELFWPGQLVTGEGLGWVCLVGKAMIKEFGKAYGYKGLDGVVPKPKPEDAAKQSHPQRPGHPHPQAVSHSSSSSGPR